MEPTLDQCPGYNLYIGGFIGLRRPKALRNCNITHIVSVLDWQFDKDAPLIKGYQHLHIPVDDVEDENLLQWFPRSNAFIEQGLRYWPVEQTAFVDGQEHPSGKGSGVYIHCAMGKSRSATVLLAYLLWSSRQQAKIDNFTTEEHPDMISLPPKPLSVVSALELLRRGRPIAEPNEGFMDQLHMYESMNCPTTEAELKSHKIYRRWMNKRSVQESLRINQAPEMDHIIFEDESSESESEVGQNSDLETSAAPRNDPRHMKEVAPGIAAPDGTQTSKRLLDPSETNLVTVKCRRCRQVIATTAFIAEHNPPPHRDPSLDQTESSDTPLPPAQCAHIFLHPLSWMRETLSDGKLEGRLSCPNKRCGINIGKFAWSGLRCSCGGWVTPGFGIIRGKVDEMVSKPSGESHQAHASVTSGSPAFALRLPPGMKKGNL